jgi:hypothetical protein
LARISNPRDQPDKTEDTRRTSASDLLEEELNEQGFEVARNGKIYMKRITSIEHIVPESSKSCEDKESTLVHTERYISTESDFEPVIEKISNHFSPSISKVKDK